MSPRVVQFVMNTAESEDNGFGTTPNNGVFSNFLKSLTMKIEQPPLETEELLTKEMLNEVKIRNGMTNPSGNDHSVKGDKLVEDAKLQFMAEKAKYEEESAIALNTLKVELEQTQSKLKEALKNQMKEHDPHAPGVGNGILNNLGVAENGPTVHPVTHKESALAGAVHFLKNKYEANNMHLSHQNDDILPDTKAEANKFVDCDKEGSTESSFYTIFGYLCSVALVFIGILSMISFFARTYGGRTYPGFLESFLYTSSTSGHVLSGRAGFGNHKKDLAHVV